MRVSQIYNLGKTQPELDFVDVDIDGDTPVFISPKALAMLPSEWGDECVHLIQDYFKEVIDLIKNNKNEEAKKLLSMLREPNETHLGVSVAKSRGRGVGNEFSNEIWNALKESKAAKSGLLEDLEDTVLMIEGIGVDMISDITTNIIRGPLIEYTQQMCRWYGIPMHNNVNSGPVWDSHKKQWTSKYVELPVDANGKLLLVPKSAVRINLQYDPQEYYQHFLLEHMKQVELDANSSLVQVLKNKKRRVTKKSLKETYGTGKKAIVQETVKYPDILEQYKKIKQTHAYPALSHEALAEIESQPKPDWDTLLKKVTDVPYGKEYSDQYEKAVEALLTALFYPALTNPIPQQKIHGGRKRIDIAYTNAARQGFFYWVAMHYPAPKIYFECKNYGTEIANPELDQIGGRFSPSRGKVGFIVCRKFENKKIFLDRCKDTAVDDRGFIIPLDDEDLKLLVESKKNKVGFEELKLLQDRFDTLIN